MRATNVSFNDEEHVKLNRAAEKFNLSKASILRYLVKKALTRDGDFKISPPKTKVKMDQPQDQTENTLPAPQDQTPPTPQNEEVQEEVVEENAQIEGSDFNQEQEEEKEPEQPQEQPQPTPQPQPSAGDFPGNAELNRNPQPQVEQPASPVSHEDSNNEPKQQAKPKGNFFGWLRRSQSQ